MNQRTRALIHRSRTIVLPVLASAIAFAADPTIALYRFQGASDGSNPQANLIADRAGNLYGTTEYNGAGGYYGTVFKLTPPSSPGGTWTETTLYSFGNHGDGARPTAGLVFDHSGRLYGTASDSNAGGYGEVFQLSPPAAGEGPWTETVLYSFQGGKDGSYPFGNVIFDPAGSLYGTTESSVFELSPPAQSGAAWNFKVLHNFACCTADGWNSVAGLVRDQQGNLYGTTEWGGSYTGLDCASLGCGTVFEVSPPAVAGGPWTETVLHSFNDQPDGLNPLTNLTLDLAGNLYGSTYGGGVLGGGMAFELSPPAMPGSQWTESVLHNFSYSAGDGAVPSALIFSPAGSLYGVTRFGGNSCVFNATNYGCGIVFELVPPGASGGAWTEILLHRFTFGGASPEQPVAGLTFDKTGKLYGTTTYGGLNKCADDGSDGCGTVFEVGQ